MTATPTVSTFDDAYPVVLRLTGRRVLVVGGGKVAVGKARGLLERGAQVTVVAPQVHPDMPVEVRVKRRRYRARDGRGAHLVFAATDDRAVNQAVFDDAEDRGVWACSVDDPDRCSFALPAVHRDGHVVIAVTTSGASPTLAQAVRDRCAAALPDDLGALADDLARARAAIRAEGGTTEGLAWRPLVDELLADDAPTPAERPERVDRWMRMYAGVTA